MGRIRITQVKSGIKRPKDQKGTLYALGFRKINQSLEFESNPALLGMVNKIKHMLVIEHLEDNQKTAPIATKVEAPVQPIVVDTPVVVAPQANEVVEAQEAVVEEEVVEVAVVEEGVEEEAVVEEGVVVEEVAEEVKQVANEVQEDIAEATTEANEETINEQA